MTEFGNNRMGDGASEYSLILISSSWGTVFGVVVGLRDWCIGVDYSKAVVGVVDVFRIELG